MVWIRIKRIIGIFIIFNWTKPILLLSLHHFAAIASAFLSFQPPAGFSQASSHQKKACIIYFVLGCSSVSLSHTGAYSSTIKWPLPMFLSFHLHSNSTTPTLPCLQVPCKYLCTLLSCTYTFVRSTTSLLSLCTTSLLYLYTLSQLYN